MQSRTSQAKPTSPAEPTANQKQVSQVVERIKTLLPTVSNNVKQIIVTIELLTQDKDYGSSNFAILQTFKKRYLILQKALENSSVSFKIAQLVQLPKTPSTDFVNATTLYNRLEMLQMQLTNQLNNLLRLMNTGSDLVDQAVSAKEAWADSLKPTTANWKIAQKAAWELHLVTTKYASLNKQAYPSMTPLTKPVKYNLETWKATAHKIKAFERVYNQQYTFPEVLYHFTKSWDMFERFKFKKWYKWSFMKTANLTQRIEKYSAVDSLGQDRLLKFTEKRKKLMNRINLVRKALHEMINSGLISQQDSSKLYRIISMLEHDAMNLQAVKLASARTMRASNQMNKLGFTEGAEILKIAARELLQKNIIKTAADDSQEIVGILRAIKSEMDSINYSKHLDALYDIKKRLDKMGRAADVEAVEKVIRDNLGSLEKLSKKLIEVYTNLSKVPLELSMAKDEALQTTEAPKEVKLPLETSKEEKAQPLQAPAKPEAKTTIEPKSVSIPSSHLEKRKMREQTPSPQLERNIPNV